MSQLITRDEIEAALIDQYNREMEEAIRLSLISESEDDQKTINYQYQDEEDEKISKSNCGPLPWYSVTTYSPQWQQRKTNLPDVENICFRECGKGGDCMFYSIAYSYVTEVKGEICPSSTCPSLKEPMKQVRKWLANSITMDNVDDFIHHYQQEKFSTEQNIRHGFREFLSWPNLNDFPETWDPYIFPTSRPLRYNVPNTGGKQKVTKEILFTAEFNKRKQQGNALLSELPEKKRKYMDPTYDKFQLFQSALTPEELEGKSIYEQKLYSAQKIKEATVRTFVQKEGWVFQGDTTTLEYLAQGDNPIRDNSIGFLVISNRGAVQCDIIPTGAVRDHYMLLYHVGGHWQLAGFADEKDQVHSIFARGQLPEVFRQLYNQDCGDDFYTPLAN